MVLGHEPGLIKLFIETHVRSDDHKKMMQQFIDSRRLVICNILVFKHFFINL